LSGWTRGRIRAHTEEQHNKRIADSQWELLSSDLAAPHSCAVLGCAAHREACAAATANCMPTASWRAC